LAIDGRAEGWVTQVLGNMAAGESREVVLRWLGRRHLSMEVISIVRSANPDPDLNDNRQVGRLSPGLLQGHPLAVMDLAYDAVGHRVVAAVASTDRTWGASVVAVDLPQGAPYRLAALPGDPAVVMVSEDGRHVYVGLAETREVLRLNGTTGEVELRLELGPGPGMVAGYAGLLPVSGRPESVVVSLPDRAVVFDGDQPRPVELYPGGIHWMTPGAQPGSYYLSRTFDPRLLVLEESGLRDAGELPLASTLALYGISVDGPWLAYHAGVLVDTDLGEVLAYFPGPGEALPLRDRGWVFQVHGPVLTVLDVPSGAVIWTAFMEDLPGTPGRLIRAGERHVAMMSPGHGLGVLDLQGMRDRYQTDLEMTLSETPSEVPVTLGGSLVARFFIRNRGPWLGEEIQFQAEIPEGLQVREGRWWGGAPEIHGDVMIDGRTVTAQLVPLLQEHGAMVELTLGVEALGTHTVVGRVTHRGQDPVGTNHQITLVLEGSVPPVVRIEDLEVRESQNPAFATLRLSEPAAENVQVTVRFEPITVTPGVDLTLAEENVVNIPRGRTNGVLQLRLRNDSLVEPDETFRLHLVSAVHATIGSPVATVTILDDDLYRFTLRTPAPSVSEGDEGLMPLRFRVDLSQPSPVPLSVSYVVGGGTAMAGEDYHATGGWLEFPPGTTNRTVTVAVRGDRRTEPDETVGLTLVQWEGVSLLGLNGSGSLMGWIRNDDILVAPTIERLVWEDATMTLYFGTQVGVEYWLEWRTAWEDAGWQKVSDPLSGTGQEAGLSHQPDPEWEDAPAGFYRVVRQP
jgi:hypothetical protein